MAQTSKIQLEDGFASAMQQLSAEAAKAIAPQLLANGAEDHVSSAEVRGEIATLNERVANLEQMITAGFEKLAAPQPASDAPDIMAQLRRMDDHLMAVRNTESVNHRLFNSLHQELKSYRDNFLRDSLQKPFIRDLIVLFDDLSTLSSQIHTAAPPADGKRNALTQWVENLENAICAVVEILHRMEVTEIEHKELVDRTCHKVVSYEPADFAEDDGKIVMRLRRGFVWRGQVLRPEEVVAKRFA